MNIVNVHWVKKFPRILFKKTNQIIVETVFLDESLLYPIYYKFSSTSDLFSMGG